MTEEEDFCQQQAKKLLGVDYLYPWQRLVIDYHLRASGYWQGSDYPRQALVVLPTGAGKSLCFTLPALLLAQPSLLIFPLRSLLFDQQRRLENRGIQVSLLVGGQQQQQRQRQWQKITRGQAKIIISNPETILQPATQQQLEKISLAQIIIDEAHTMVEWGEQFRPAYLQLAEYLDSLKQRPAPPLICAYTATASPLIKQKLRQYLFHQDFYCVQANPDRKNINYRILPTLSKTAKLEWLINRVEKPILIFCNRRNSCEYLAYQLGRRYPQLQLQAYHAGLGSADKAQLEQWFFKAKEAVLIATCAYGMGVDKANIRTVIHYQLSASIEAYLQESGRAGRDNNRSQAIMIYGLEDCSGCNSRRQVKLLQICQNFRQCRRQQLLQQLGSNCDFCTGCDVCNGNASPIPTEWHDFDRAIRWRWQGIEQQQLALFLQGQADSRILAQGLHHHPGYGSYPNWSISQLEQAIKSFLQVDWLNGSLATEVKPPFKSVKLRYQRRRLLKQQRNHRD